ncbi:MAG: arylsulfatase [Bdellovibrionales bacterium]
MPKNLWVFHPSPNLVETMDSLIKTAAPKLIYETIIFPDLLSQAIQEGLTDSVQTKVEEAVLSMPEGSDNLMLCTCSTIGGIAEQIGHQNSRQVLRIDRPMGEQAIKTGGLIGVCAALASTLGPTVDMLHAIAKEKRHSVKIKPLLCEGAWEKKKQGDDVGYIKDVANFLRENLQGFNVIVLAQGSMAPVKDILGATTVPILSSPQLAVNTVLTVLKG